MNIANINLVEQNLWLSYCYFDIIIRQKIPLVYMVYSTRPFVGNVICEPRLECAHLSRQMLTSISMCHNVIGSTKRPV